jgi:hypothetical protein
MEPVTLCSFCSKIDFSLVSYHPQGIDYKDMFAEERNLSEISDSASTCFLCEQVMAFYERWESQKYGKLTRVAPDKIRATFSAYRLGSTDREVRVGNNKHLVYLSIDLTAPKPS